MSGKTIGFIAKLQGAVQVRTTDGIVKVVMQGDAVHAGEVLVTGDGAEVLIEFLSGKRLEVGANAEVLLDETVHRAEPFSDNEVAGQVETLQQAILQGEGDKDLAELEAPAAGPGQQATPGNSLHDMPNYQRLGLEGNVDSRGALLSTGGDAGPQDLSITLPEGVLGAAANTAPVAADVSASGAEDAPSIAVTLSASDIDGTVAAYTVTALPTNGTLYADAALSQAVAAGAPLPGPTLYFVPAPDWNGTTGFTYTATDDAGATSNPATATLTVTPVNDAPVAADVSASGAEDAPSIAVTLSASDIDGTVAAYTVTTLPTNGTLYADAALSQAVAAGTPLPGPTLYFVPAPDWNGTTGFTYTATDDAGATSAPATASLTVTPVNDAPVAADVSASGAEDAPSIAVTLSASDIDGTVAAYTVTTLPANGTLYADAALSQAVAAGTPLPGPTLYFVPAPDWNGTTGFTYTATDDAGATSAPATASLTVTPVNDAPVAADVSASGAEDAPSIAVTLSASDIDGTVAAYTVTTLPANGTLYADAALSQAVAAGTPLPGPTLYFVPAPDWNGTTGFTYTATDDAGATSAPATASLTVTPVNDAPVAADVSASGAEDAPSIAVTLSASDIDGTVAAYTVTTLPTNGTLYADAALSQAVAAGTPLPGPTLYFVPAPDWNGTTGFTYTATDDAGATSNPATATLTVTPVNDAPVAVDVSASGAEDAPSIAVTLSASDIDGTVAAYTVTALPTNGTLYADAALSQAVAAGAPLPGPTLYFVPAPDWNGTTGFTYTATDDAGATSNPATATLTVTPVNDAPVAADVSASGAEDAPSIAVTLSASDIDGTVAAYTVTALPANGTLYADAALSQAVAAGAPLPGPTLYFVPAPDWNGTTGFTYTATDDAGATSAPATASLTVTPVNDAPVAVDVSASGAEDAPSIAVTLSASDIDGTVAAYTVTALPTNGTLYADAALSQAVAAGTPLPGPTLYFVPAPDWNGTTGFTYTATDDAGATSAPATASLTVTPVNDAPVAADVSASGAEDAPSIAVTLSASDIDGTVAAYTVTTLPANGTLYADAALSQAVAAGTPLPGPTLYFVPAPDWNGTTGFTYTATDDAGATSNPATATLTVTPVNDAPVAADVSASGAEDAPSIAVTLSASDIDGMVAAYTVTALPTNGTLYADAALSQAVAAGMPLPGPTLYFVPAPDWNGTTGFTYTATDDAGATSNPATATLTVTPVADAPVVTVDAASVTAREDNAVTDLSPPVDQAAVYGVGFVAVPGDGDGSEGITSVRIALSGLQVGLAASDAPDATVLLIGGQVVTEGASVTVDTGAGTATATAQFDLAGNALTLSFAGPVGRVDLSAGGTTPLAVRLPRHSDDDFTVRYEVHTREAGDPTATAMASGETTVEVRAVADAPTVSTAGALTLTAGGAAVALPVAVGLADTDGSESIERIEITVGSPDVAFTWTGTAALDHQLMTWPDGARLIIHYPSAAALGELAGGALTLAMGAGVEAGSHTVRVLVGAREANPEGAVAHLQTRTEVVLDLTVLPGGPSAQPDSVTVAEDASVTVDVLANDTAGTAGGLVVSVASGQEPAHGTVVVNADNTLTYTPAADYSGADSFHYTVTDAAGNTSTATVDVTVTPVADAPVVTVDAASVTAREDNAVTDLSPPVDQAAVYGVGFVAVPGDGDGSEGITSVRIALSGLQVGLAASDAPDATVLLIGGQVVTEGASVTVDTGAGTATATAQFDLAGNALTLSFAGPVGRVDLSAGGTTPLAVRLPRHSDDDFTVRYEVHTREAGDPTATAMASGETTVEVRAVADAPTVSTAGALTLTAGGAAVALPVAVGLADTDGSESIERIEITVGSPDVAFTWTGTAALDHQLMTWPDGARLIIHYPSAAALGELAGGALTLAMGAGVEAGSHTVRVLVGAREANPEGAVAHLQTRTEVVLDLTVLPGGPSAQPDSVTVAEDASVTVDVLANDTAGTAGGLVVSVASGQEPAHGTVVVNADNTLTYTPAADYSGADSFHYTVTDAAGNTSTATVDVTVTPVADAPAVVTPTITGTLMDDRLAPESAAFGRGIGESSTPYIVGQTFVAAAGQLDSIAFRGKISTGTDDIEYRIMVAETTANPDGTYSIGNVLFHSGQQVIPAGTNTFTLFSVATGGINLVAGQSYVVLFEGISDADAIWGFGTAQVWSGGNPDGVLLLNQVDSPTSTVQDELNQNFSADLYRDIGLRLTYSGPFGAEDTAIAIPLDVGLVDTDGSESITSMVLSGVPTGAVLNYGTDNGDGSWTLTGATAAELAGLTITPPLNHNGTFTLTVTVTSTELANGASATTTTSFDVAVMPVNDAPTAGADTFSTDEDTPLIIPKADLLANDSDVEGGGLGVASYTQPNHGTVIPNAAGDLVYTPAANFSGADSFSYTLSDANGGSSVATVSVTVNQVDTAENDTILYDGTLGSIDGGAGVDTLLLPAGETLDFGRLHNLERIDLQNGDHALSVSYEDVLAATDENHVLTILGDSADSVTLENAGGHTWTNAGTEVKGGTTYHIYTSDGVTIKIEDGVQVH